MTSPNNKIVPKKRITKAEQRKLDQAEKMKKFQFEHQAAMAARRLGKARNMDWPDIVSMKEFFIVNGIPSEEEILKEMKESFALLRAHPECFESFNDYICAFNGSTNPSECQVCGSSLMCGDKVAKHIWRELSQAECQVKNISHFGMCWHVNECRNCGLISAYDSSD